MIAKTIFGLEEVLAEELTALGALNVNVLKRAVSFYGDKGFMYKANLCCRTALRILKPINTFSVKDNEDLYKQIYDIKWEDFLEKTGTLAVDAVGTNDFINHTQYLSQRVKDAIVDSYRDKYGIRPSVDLDNPSLRINIHLFNDQVTVSLDSSGSSLHKRGYRKVTNLAPLNEVLAAGMILLSGWNRNSVFIDPMCGSGTLPIEASLYAFNIPAGYYRKDFGFMYWPDFDEELWETIYNSALSKQREFYYDIIGSDISGQSLKFAGENIKNAKLHNDIKLYKSSITDFKPEAERGIVIMNPPYGERLEEKDINGFYKSIGDAMKKNFQGFDVWLISSDLEAIKHIGLRPSRKITLYNGPLECKFLKYQIYSGSKKAKYNQPE